MATAIERWEEMQRHGQDMAERFSSIAQGIGSMFQGQILTSSGVCKLQVLDSSRQGWQLPWPWSTGQELLPTLRLEKPVGKLEAPEISSALYDVGHRLSQAGSDLGACVGGLVARVTNQFNNPAAVVRPAACSSGQRSPGAISLDEAELGKGSNEWRERGEEASGGIVLSSWQDSSISRQRFEERPANSEELPESVSNDDAMTKTTGHFHKQSTISITTTFDSRTQDIESSVVARGDLWRAEASHGSASSSNGSSPLFLLQVGPVLLVRDTTLLLPIHLSKRHLLWYGFDRKSGLHSLSPAIWSKNRRWLLMSMLCLNPLTCSFTDLQFPNGQMTYVAGEGISGSAFLPVHGGLLQVQGRHPGESKLSFSCKNRWGTKVCPSLHFPEKSLSIGITQALVWQRSGLLLRPAVQISVTPTFGGRNSGWRAEVVHSPKEQLSFSCGCSSSLEPTAFASVSIGRSKRNGETTGSSGLVLQVETPVENPRRASFSLQLNSGVEF